jgi:hypothetical protein
MFKATLAQAWGVAIDWPLAHVLFQASMPPLLDMKQPALTPE